MAEIRIRPALGEEREVLEALQYRAAIANEGDRQAILDHPDAIELPLAQIESGLVIVAEIGGAVAGFAALLQRDDTDVELDGLFVEPGLWRTGVGHVLVKRCCELGRQMNAEYLHVLGNSHALGFYEKCDFQKVGVQVTRFGSGVLMRKAL